MRWPGQRNGGDHCNNNVQSLWVEIEGFGNIGDSEIMYREKIYDNG